MDNFSGQLENHARDFAEIANVKWSVKTIIARSSISPQNEREGRKEGKKTRKGRKRMKERKRENEKKEGGGGGEEKV